MFSDSFNLSFLGDGETRLRFKILFNVVNVYIPSWINTGLIVIFLSDLLAE